MRSRLDEFLFHTFRDTARRILWPVVGGDRFEQFDECAALFTPEIKGLAITALSTGDTKALDDTVSRLLYNLHADLGYNTTKPQWWRDEAHPAAPERGGKVEARKQKIRAILGKIEGLDPAFSLEAMPGRKADFFDLCKKLDREFRHITLATFSDYLPGLCAFQRGAHETAYYSEIAAKLG